MSKYLDDYLLTLAHVMGERTVQTTTRTVRTTFIQETLREIYRAYQFPDTMATITLAVDGGIASLPSTVDLQQGIEAYFYTGDNQTTVEHINPIDQTGYNDGSYRFWIEPQSDGTALLHTKDTGYSSLVVKVQNKVPDLATASVAVPFDDTMAVALGARRYIKLSQDPNADISQDEALFQKRITETIATTQVNNPRRRARFLHQANGHRMGGGFDY